MPVCDGVVPAGEISAPAFNSSLAQLCVHGEGAAPHPSSGQ